VLGNSVLAKPDLDAGRLVIPFSHSLESKNAFYLVVREAQAELGKIVSFKEWMLSMVEQEEQE
jgi:LysR family glycine cleavage system transcriptional activator